MTHQLLTAYRLQNGLEIKNRIVKAAMSEAMGTKDLQPKKEIVSLYESWAKGGSGLIITGNVMVDSHYLAELGNIVFDQQSDMALLKQWAQAGQVNGAKVMVQLNHPGKQAPKTVCKAPVAPSAVPIEGPIGDLFFPPRELTVEEIKQLIGQFARAAKVAKDAGFVGVEIHAAHGYLINQFLSPYDNRRTDRYGGSPENRLRFLKEVYQAIRKDTGAGFTVGLKLNSSDFKDGGFSEEDSLFVIQQMEKAGIDFIEVSGGSYENPKMQDSSSKNKEAPFFAAYSKKVKERVQLPVIVTGGIRSISSMTDLLESNASDFIGLARPLAIMPDLPNRIASKDYVTLETKRVTTGIAVLDKKLGGVLGLAYYQMLMQTYARGKRPKGHYSGWTVLLYTLFRQGAATLVPQRAKKQD